MTTATTTLAFRLAEASPYAVLTFALASEKAAARGYAALARAAEFQATRAKLLFLRAEEAEHARLLMDARRGLKRPKQFRPIPGVAEPIAAPNGRSLTAALRAAVKAENNAQELYVHCAGRARRAEIKSLFRHLAEEEAGHARLLKAELTLLAGPPVWSSLEGQPPIETDFWPIKR